MNTNTKSISEIIEDFERDIRNAIEALPIKNGKELGLDIRAGSKLFIDEDERTIYCPSYALRALDYYGGFEYVAEGEGRTTLSGYVRFDGYESERVAECFEFLNDVDSEDAE